MNIASFFSTFCSNIAIPQSKRTTMSNRRKAIAKRLNLDFRGYSTESYCFYAGSVGRNTANKSVSDIDMIFVMPWNIYTKYDNYQSNGQSQFLQAVKNSIATTYPSTYLKGDGQVVVVNFSDGMKFEVVPAFENSDGTYTYADSNNGGSWLKTNPKAEIKTIKDGDSKTNNNLHQLCRMMRSWRSKCDVPIKSCLLDTLAFRFLTNYEYKDKSYLYYDWMCRDFFLLLSNVDKDQYLWKMVGSGNNVYNFDNFRPKAKKAYEKAVSAIDYATSNCDFSAASDWHDIFGGDFPWSV